MPEDVMIERLRALAATPVDPAVEAAHLSLMEAAPPVGRPGRARAMVAGGTLAVALFAGTGIAAAAGNLPGPVQDAAHGALKKVGVKVPKGTPVACEDAVNHGQYVRSQPKGGEARSAAVKSDCGKKDKTADADKAPGAEQQKGKSADAEKGKPADAGANKPADAGKPAEPGKPADAGKPADKPAPAAPAKAKQPQPETAPAKPSR